MPEQHVVVGEIRPEATGVVSLALRSATGAPLAPWVPGAHIDVELPNWLRRQYSLCGDPAEREHYRIAVRREPRSRGGSEYIHDFLRPRQELTISLPRNNFPLVDADEYLFVAGGIGITPILPMVRHTQAAGAGWRLLYAGRRLDSMPFLAELLGHPDRVEIVPEDQHGIPDLAGAVARTTPDTPVYGCGPQPMLDALRAAVGLADAGRLHTELFRAPRRAFRPNTGFVVRCARSRLELPVRPEDSLLDVLTRAGLRVGVGCREGVCGSCEIPVVEGSPEHRDELGPPDDRRMYPCVSRSWSDRLTVDL